MYKKYSAALGLFAVCLLTLPASAAGELAGKSITICDDGAEWPPFTFYEREGAKRTKNVVGFSVDVIKIIASDAHAKTTLVLIPWEQCLEKVARGEYDMALNASYNDERATFALFSEPFYSLTPSVVFLREKYKDGFKMASAAALAKVRTCGLRGYGYDDFGLDVAVIDREAANFNAAFQKLRTGRCDVLLARIEVLEGFAKVGNPYLTADVDHRPIPGADTSQFHMLISKQSKNRDALVAAINRGIGKLKASGKLPEMLDRYRE